MHSRTYVLFVQKEKTGKLVNILLAIHPADM